MEEKGGIVEKEWRRSAGGVKEEGQRVEEMWRKRE